ncbi:MAG: hypothetical protein VKL39_23860 [Leptolyngbyaceae bacterium]|nr:hypothetical protein [Leptolyngbyaceae bacterium]
MHKINDVELLEKWAQYLADNPNEVQRLCDRSYELFREELWNQQERSGHWNHRL